MIVSARRIWPIALNTLREAIRNRLLYALFFFVLAVMGTSVLIASLSYVEGERIIQDMGLGAIKLFSVGIAIFVGIGLIHGEVERRTVYTILSKSVTRSEFLLGKYLGLLLTVWLQLALMAFAFAGIALASGTLLSPAHLAAIWLIAVELALIVAVATLFSTFTTPMLAALFTLGVYCIGHLTRDLQALGQQAEQAGIRSVVRGLYTVLPDLDSFDLSSQAVHGLALAPGDVGWPMLYGVGYVFAVLIVATFVFRVRDLK
ncbi:MAG: ABC transporter permease subunit [Myxococcota bacterium]